MKSINWLGGCRGGANSGEVWKSCVVIHIIGCWGYTIMLWCGTGVGLSPPWENQYE